jgi:acyl-homoserine lactone acylase PvdQ
MNIRGAYKIVGASLLLTSATWIMAKPAEPAPTAPAKLTLYRDAMGVPHIVGATSAAVMYGVGYSEAQDRLVGLELNRRASTGRGSPRGTASSTVPN